MRIGYATVSQVDSSIDTQVRELGQAGCERVFTDGTASVRMASRPGLSGALDYLRKDDTFVTLIDPTTSEGQMLWRFFLALTVFER